MVWGLSRRWVLVPLAAWFQTGSGLVHLQTLKSFSGSPIRLGCAMVHLGTLESFLGQLSLLLLTDLWPLGTWLSGVLVPGLY